MNLFQLGNFRLASGAESRWKIECDALTDGDWQALAAMIADLVGPFSSVDGVPRGGLKLAKILNDYRDTFGPHLIVDDVLTTGGSMEQAKLSWLEKAAKGKMGAWDQIAAQVVGAVVFARGPCPSWVKPLFQLPEPLWVRRGQ